VTRTRWQDRPGRLLETALAPDGRSPVVWLVPLVSLIGLIVVQFSGVNRELFVQLNGLSRATGTAPWAWLTVLGDTAVALALFGPLALRKPHLLWALALSALVATLFVHGIKPWLQWPRPPAVLPSESITVIGSVLTRKSFPSGHTATAFVAAGLLWMHRFPRGLCSVALVLAIGVGLSRIVVGAHWPMDVLAGAALGWGAAWLGSALAQRLPLGRHPRMQWALAIVIAGCALAALTVLQTGQPQARWLQQLVGAASLCALALTVAGWRRGVR